jgi:hypothetical protein
MAIDLAVAEFRHRVAEHVFLNSGQLSALCRRPLDLHRFMEQFAQLMAQPLGVILVEGDPEDARATVESFLENARMLLRLEIRTGEPSAER